METYTQYRLAASVSKPAQGAVVSACHWPASFLLSILAPSLSEHRLIISYWYLVEGCG